MIEITTSKFFEDNKKNKHSRHASSGKMYLYDVLEIKKETSKSCQEYKGIYYSFCLYPGPVDYSIIYQANLRRVAANGDARINSFRNS